MGILKIKIKTYINYNISVCQLYFTKVCFFNQVILSSMIKECEQKVENKTVQEPQGSMSIAASLVSEDTKTKFLNKMGQLTTSGAMLANVFQRKK